MYTRMEHWLVTQPPVNLDDAKSYVDSIDKKACECFNKFKNEHRTALEGIEQVSILHPVLKYTEKEAIDKMNKFVLLIMGDLTREVKVYWELENVFIPDPKYWMYCVSVKEAQNGEVENFRIMMASIDLNIITVKQYVEVVVSNVRSFLEDIVLPAIVKDLGGVSPRLKVGKSFICKKKKCKKLNPYDTATWTPSKGIGSRWHSTYKSLGYTKMRVLVALTDNDLPVCFKKYGALFGDCEPLESVVLDIEDALVRHKCVRSYNKGRRTEGPGDGTLIGCRLDNDLTRKRPGKSAGKGKDGFVVYVVYRPDWEQKAADLEEKNAGLELKVKDLERENARQSDNNPSEQV